MLTQSVEQPQTALFPVAEFADTSSTDQRQGDDRSCAEELGRENCGVRFICNPESMACLSADDAFLLLKSSSPAIFCCFLLPHPMAGPTTSKLNGGCWTSSSSRPQIVHADSFNIESNRHSASFPRILEDQHQARHLVSSDPSFPMVSADPHSLLPSLASLWCSLFVF